MVDQIKSLDIPKWKVPEDDQIIYTDGDFWKMSYENDGHTSSISGMYEYPNQWESFWDILSELKIPSALFAEDNDD